MPHPSRNLTDILTVIQDVGGFLDSLANRATNEQTKHAYGHRAAALRVVVQRLEADIFVKELFAMSKVADLINQFIDDEHVKAGTIQQLQNQNANLQSQITTLQANQLDQADDTAIEAGQQFFAGGTTVTTPPTDGSGTPPTGTPGTPADGTAGAPPTVTA